MDINSLTVLVGGLNEDLLDVEYTEDGLRLFIAEALKDKGELVAGLTVDDIMNSPLFANLRTTCEEGYKKALEGINAQQAKRRRERQITEEKILAVKVETLVAMMREEYGLPLVLTQAEIDAQLEESLARKAVAGGESDDQYEENEFPPGLLVLREQFGDKLPDQVYSYANDAILFRVVLIGFVKPFNQKLKEEGLDAEYRANIEVMQKEVSTLLNMTTQVIFAWGDNKQTRVDDPQLYRAIFELAREDERYAWLSYCPTPEEFKLRAEAMAKATAKDEQEQISRGLSREEIANKLVAVGYDADAARKIAHKTVKNYFDECRGNVGLMIRMSATNKMVAAESDECRAVAQKIARADNMSADELDAAVTEHKKQKERNSFIRQCVPGYGAEKPSTAATHKLNKKGGKKKVTHPPAHK